MYRVLVLLMTATLWGQDWREARLEVAGHLLEPADLIPLEGEGSGSCLAGVERQTAAGSVMRFQVPLELVQPDDAPASSIALVVPGSATAAITVRGVLRGAHGVGLELGGANGPGALVTFAADAIAQALAAPRIETSILEYHDGEQVLEGYLARPAWCEPRGGVLICHAWMGQGEHEREGARQLAQLGYVALAADVYGKGVRASNRQEAAQLAGQYRGDRALFRQRVQAGLAALQSATEMPPSRLGAIGYCFGGTAVLELARGGADLAGVVSFHGGLSSPTPEDAKQIRCKVLILHGADDPHVPPEEVAACMEELRGGGVDWQLVHYSGAVHAFTDPGAGDDPSRGAAYHPVAARRSWQAMERFFQEILQGN